MSKRIRAFSDTSTNPPDEDFFAIDHATGSTSLDRTYKITWGNIKSLIASALMTLTNKTLTNPTISGGMSVAFSTKVTNLNSDSVDGLEPGDARGDLASWGEEGDQGCLDVGFQGRIESEYVRVDRGLSAATTSLETGTYSLLASMGGHIRCDLSSGGINLTLPSADSTNAGLRYLITVVTAGGSNNVSISRAGTDTITRMKDDLSSTSWTTMKLSAAKDCAILESNGSGRWIVIGGYGISS